MPIILASSSKSRQLLLQRLQLTFTQEAPNVDETPHEGEAPDALTARLAALKVDAVIRRLNTQAAIVIGSDQVAIFQGRIIGKPKNEAQAIAGLLAMSGQKVHFYTSLCVRRTDDNRTLSTVEQTEVVFRDLQTDEVKQYVKIERPLGAAGGFHAERLGIALFDAINSSDPTSLIGLPLIKLTGFLRQLGVSVLAP